MPATSASEAHIDPSTVLDVLIDAMRGDWRRALARWPLRVFGLLSRDEWLAAVGRGPPSPPHATIERLLRLPQYGAANDSELIERSRVFS